MEVVWFGVRRGKLEVRKERKEEGEVVAGVKTVPSVWGG